MSNHYSIGIDWGGTRIKLGAVDGNGRLLRQMACDCPRERAIDEAMDALLEITETLIAECGEAPLAIGLGLTGPVDPDLGVVLLPGKIKGLEGYPVVPRFRERFGVPVTAANDGTVSLIAERTIGKARDVDWAVVLTIGTGVGSGVMIEGRIPSDPHFMFGTQMGHLVQNSSNDQLCLVGVRGSAEMACSATALALAVRGGLQRGVPSTLSDRYFENPHSIDFQAVIEAGVEQDDPLCIDELRRWTTQLGWLVVNAIHAYSPQVVILSGGATLASGHFLPQLQSHVDQHIFRYPKGEPVPIVVSSIQEYSGVVGAALMAAKKAENKEKLSV